MLKGDSYQDVLNNIKILRQKLDCLDLDLNKEQEEKMVMRFNFFFSMLKKPSISKEDVSFMLENYMKSTVKFVEPYYDIIYTKDTRKQYDSEYAAIIDRKASPLGVCKAVKLILEVLGYNSTLGYFEREGMDQTYINYVVYLDDILIDPYNSHFCDRNLIKNRIIYSGVDIIKLSDDFFKHDINYYEKYEIVKYLDKQ